MAAAQPRGAGGPGSPGQARRGQRGRRGRRPRGRRRRASRRLRPGADQGRAPGCTGASVRTTGLATSATAVGFRLRARKAGGPTRAGIAAPERGVTSANGNHSARHGTRGPFDAALTSFSDAAEPAESAAAEEFSWLQKSEPETGPADGELTWPEPADQATATWRSADRRPGCRVGGRDRIGAARRHRADSAASAEGLAVTGADRLLGQAGSRAPGRPAHARHGATSRRAGDRAGVLALACRHHHALGRGTRSPERYRLGPAAQHACVHGDRRPLATGTGAVRTGSSRCDCWRSSSSPRSSAARWCCC